MTEDEMVGWHHQLNGYEFEQAPGVGDGLGGLACCRPWGRKESDTTERLNCGTAFPVINSVQRITTKLSPSPVPPNSHPAEALHPAHVSARKTCWQVVPSSARPYTNTPRPHCVPRTVNK